MVIFVHLNWTGICAYENEHLPTYLTVTCSASLNDIPLMVEEQKIFYGNQIESYTVRIDPEATAGE